MNSKTILLMALDDKDAPRYHPFSLLQDFHFKR